MILISPIEVHGDELGVIYYH